MQFINIWQSIVANSNSETKFNLEFDIIGQIPNYIISNLKFVRAYCILRVS